MNRPSTKRSFQTLSAASLLLLAAACSRAGANQDPVNMPPPRVEYEPAIQKTIVDQVELTGRLAATDFVEVRPRISGHIQEIRFEAGQIVEKGAVLFVIDPRWQQADLARATAQLEGAKVRLAVTEKELTRAQSLVESRAISSEELEARSGRVQEALAAVAAAQAAVATAQLDVEFTEIRAPIQGRVSRPLVTVGNHVSGVAGMTTVMTTLVSIDPVHFYCDLDETTFLRFRTIWNTAKQKNERIVLSLALGDEKDYPHQGVVESLDNQVDMKSGTMALRGLFHNPDGSLVPGLYGRALLPLGKGRDAVLVPERAINTDQNQKFVLVVGEGDKAEYRKIKLGGFFEGMREIQEGVKASERVIVAGHAAKVRPGMPVAPELAANKPSTPSAR